MLPEKPWKQMKPKDVWFMIHVLAKQDQETRTRLPTTWILHLWTPPTNFRSTVCAIIQSMGQLANICICALGGSFHLSKCSWRCFVPTKSRGKPDVIDIEQDLQIFPTQDSPAETILHLSKGTSHCQLRVQVVPSLSPKSQLALLQQKCRTFSLQIRRNSLSPHQSSVVFYCTGNPISLRYTCNPEQWDGISSEDSPWSASVKTRNFANTFARHALYTPSQLGGANLKSWSLKGNKLLY